MICTRAMNPVVYGRCPLRQREYTLYSASNSRSISSVLNCRGPGMQCCNYWLHTMQPKYTLEFRDVSIKKVWYYLVNFGFIYCNITDYCANKCFTILMLVCTLIYTILCSSLLLMTVMQRKQSGDRFRIWTPRIGPAPDPLEICTCVFGANVARVAEGQRG